MIFKNTPGYNQQTQKLSRKWTVQEANSKNKIIDYYPIPQIKPDPDQYTFAPNESVKEIKGTFTDETGSGGTVSIKKGSTVLYTFNYSGTARNTEWKFTLKKEDISSGKNELKAEIKSKYSDYMTDPVSIFVNIQKELAIRYFEAKPNNQRNPLPDDILTTVKKVIYGTVGEEISFEVPELLGESKFKYNPIRTGMTENDEQTIKHLVTEQNNDIDVYYSLNSVTGKIEYLNAVSLKRIFSSTTSKERKEIRETGAVTIGTALEPDIIKASDKVAEGYQFDRIEVKHNNQFVTDGKVPDSDFIVTIYFTPVLSLERPEVINFGSHTILKNDDEKEMTKESNLIVISTVESSSGILTPWKITSEFSGFSGKEKKKKLNGQLKYQNNEITSGTAIETKTQREIPKTEILLKDKLKLNVFGSGNLSSKYDGIITWNLENTP
ncbi:hypothetical protein [Vagococcus silagei]|uniref:WxL domain-containing protein n=1 Tax=Vagococcus silagei TaxID=2508885 RepID=A0A4S3B5J6_9ENTE|nr:hypothetical protein [Vagococcus silagei]THB61577.1 hypothetical protein ESZ54_03740 [Vagococcus silagei]